MKTVFTATAADEAQQVFGKTFYTESLPMTQPELDERVQLGAFLRAYAQSRNCSFPIQVNIQPRDQRPDFKVSFGGVLVGIETSKIANSELEEVRSAQRQEGLGTLEISSLLQQRSKRTRKQNIAECTKIPVFIFGDPHQIGNERDFWMQQARAIIKRKYAKTNEPTFNRYGQCWLLLWDKLSYEEELGRRIGALEESLGTLWQNSFFEKIIIQQQHSERFFILSRQGVEILQREPVYPVAEFSMPDELSSDVER